jgi:hypothetical protein
VGLNSSDGKNQYIFIVGSLRRQSLFIFLIATNVEILTAIIGDQLHMFNYGYSHTKNNPFQYLFHFVED